MIGKTLCNIENFNFNHCLLLRIWLAFTFYLNRPARLFSLFMHSIARNIMRSSLKTNHLSLGLILAVSFWLQGLVHGKDWQVYKVNGIDYITAENLAKFYQFQRFAKEGDNRIFSHPSLIMRWKTGSQSIYVNNIKFNLSFPVVESGDKALLSTVDLAKLVDPVVRPSYISKPINFDTVVIDAGHGGHDSGAKGVMGYEKHYALDLALRLEQSLRKRGFKTLMTRRSDNFLTLGQRVDIANRQKKAIFISVHLNSSGSRSASGIETYALAPQGTRSTNGGSNPWGSSLLNGNTRDAENIALGHGGTCSRHARVAGGGSRDQTGAIQCASGDQQTCDFV